ncbi:MAG: GIY-YIG nuclease family protein [Patescibacteria group bacterium]|nr:GIY-YIG nuclease family protein [Patescibacteria group bacterium]
MYYVYLLKCSDGTIYTGITTDIERRFQEHKSGKGGHYTSSRKAVKLLYTEKQKDRSSASRREAEIKKWDREKKLHFVREAAKRK